MCLIRPSGSGFTTMAWVPNDRCVTPLNARHCRAHLQWPRWHVGRAIQQWSSLMFIVESRITLHRNDGQQHAWRRRGVCHALSTWSQHWSRTPQSISGVVRLCPHHHVTSRKPKLLWSQNGAPFCKQYSTSSEECKPEMFFFFFFIYIYIYFLICFLQYHKSSHFRYTINFIINKNCIFGIQALAPLTSSTCLCFPLLLTLVAFSLLSHYVLQVVHTQLAPFDP